MKKSRIAKLALLGASTAALAATLTTSTYAWYVSNKTANVTGGQAATGSAGSDGSILLSWTGDESKWFKTISLTDTDKVATLNPLQPVHYDTDGFYSLAVNGSKQTIKGAASTDYVTFTVKIKSLQGTGYQTVVTPTLSFTNYGGDSTYTTPAAAPTQIAMAAAGLPTSVENGAAFYVDALNSMYVQQVISGGSTSYSPANAQSCTGAALTGAKTGGDAHTYYNAVTGNTVTWGATTNWTTGGLSPITIVESTVYTITYNIFLDGADTDCFNSAAGQYFKFELKFEAADSTEI